MSGKLTDIRILENTENLCWTFWFNGKQIVMECPGGGLLCWPWNRFRSFRNSTYNECYVCRGNQNFLQMGKQFSTQKSRVANQRKKQNFLLSQGGVTDEKPLFLLWWLFTVMRSEKYNSLEKEIKRTRPETTLHPSRYADWGGGGSTRDFGWKLGPLVS